MPRVIVRKADTPDGCRVFIFYSNMLWGASPCDSPLSGVSEWLRQRLSDRDLARIESIARRLRPGEEESFDVPYPWGVNRG